MYIWSCSGWLSIDEDGCMLLPKRLDTVDTTGWCVPNNPERCTHVRMYPLCPFRTRTYTADVQYQYLTPLDDDYETVTYISTLIIKLTYFRCICPEKGFSPTLNWVTSMSCCGGWPWYTGSFSVGAIRWYEPRYWI